MRLTLVCLLVLSLTGCAAFGSTPAAYKDMTAEQIREVVKDKASSIVCTRGIYAGASLTILAVNTDKGIPAGITVTEECRVTVDQRLKDKDPPK